MKPSSPHSLLCLEQVMHTMGHRLGLDRLVHYLWRQEWEHMFPEWTYTTPRRQRGLWVSTLSGYKVEDTEHWTQCLWIDHKLPLTSSELSLTCSSLQLLIRRASIKAVGCACLLNKEIWGSTRRSEDRCSKPVLSSKYTTFGVGSSRFCGRGGRWSIILNFVQIDRQWWLVRHCAAAIYERTYR